MKILFENNELLICIKPAGIPSQSDKSGDIDIISLLSQQINSTLFPIHRLDRNVGGIMVFAKTKDCANFLTQKISNGDFSKKYLAILCGKAEKENELCDYLLKNSRLNISKVVNKNSPNSKEARLFYKPLKYTEKDGQILTLARITLFTGRHHQIRVQMANAGFPLYGDTKYNPMFLRKKNSSPIGLWAEQLTLPVPPENKEMTFTAPPQSEIFKELL